MMPAARRYHPHLVQMINDSSLTVKIIATVVVLFYLLSFISASHNVLSIVPGYLIPPQFRLWTLITSPLFEDKWWCVLLDFAALYATGKLLEPIWGLKELVKFFGIVCLSSNLVTFVIFYLVYIATFSTSALFKTFIHGLVAFNASVTVGIRQLMPEHVLVTLPLDLGKIRNRHLSFICTIIIILFVVFHFCTIEYPLLFISGIFSSWIYLRFFQIQANGGKGDLNDNFSFSGFFPNHLEPPVAIVSNSVYYLLVRAHICKKRERRYDLGAPTSIGLTVAGSDPQDTERRKQIALKALNDRLTKTDKTPWPTLVDEEQTPLRVSESKIEVPDSVEVSMPSEQDTKESEDVSRSQTLDVMTESMEGAAAVAAGKRLSNTELAGLPVPNFREVVKDVKKQHKEETTVVE